MSAISNIEDRLAVIKAIGDVCSFRLMDNLTEICLGKHVINEIAAPNDKQFVIAQASLDWADRLGIETNLIAIVLRATSDHNDKASVALRETVRRVLPAAFDAPPSVALQVDRVVEALNALRTSLGENEIRTTIFQSKTALNSVIERIRMLMTYKSLHDNLHRIQLNPKRMLLKAARKVSTGKTFDEPFEILSSYVNQLLLSVVGSRSLVQQFHQEADAKREILWIDEMEAAAKRCQKGLDDGDPGPVKNGVNMVYALIDEHSPRLNDQIFAETTALPLSKLTGPLSLVRAKSANLAPGIDKALKAIGELNRVLISRVAAHNRLQSAERNLSILAQCLEHREDDMILPEFTDLWPETRTTVQTLSVYSLDPAQLTFEAKLTDAVDGRLLDIEAAADKVVDNSGLVDALETAFLKFHDKALLQSFEVDSQLKAGFEKLDDIARSLQNVLGDVP